MSDATRIYRQRRKGWRMPEGAVYVGRPTPWGNPYSMSKNCDEACVVQLFKGWMDFQLRQNREWLEPLRGHDLVCWCPLYRPCHADAILDRLREPRP